MSFDNRYRIGNGSRTVVNVLSIVSLITTSVGCASSSDSDAPEASTTIVVSNVLLGAVVSEVAGPAAKVVVLIPNGVDPHVYEPSAKDVEQMVAADLVVVNGLGLEERLEDSLDRVRAQRIPIFEATDHLGVRAEELDVRPEEVDASGTDEAHSHDTEAHETSKPSGGESQAVVDHEGHQHGDDDPHFWTDPRLMAEVVEEFGMVLEDLGLDIGDRARMFSERLLTFDQKMLELVNGLPEERRILVTGHESLGYFAERYGFDIVGTIIPGLTSAAEVSAANLADVKEAIETTGVEVIFTELGTSADSARVLSKELGVDVVEISTHLLSDGAVGVDTGGDAYIGFIEDLVTTVVAALAE